jgi:hypothetical protein
MKDCISTTFYQPQLKGSELVMGKLARKTKLKGRKSTSKTPANVNGMILSPSKSGNLKIIKNKFIEEYNEGTVLVEIPPCKRTIFFEKTPYFLSFPKVLFFMRYLKARNESYYVQYARMAFTKARKRTLLIPPLTNIGLYNLEVCLSSKCKGTTLEEMASNQIADIFRSQFNCDITDVFENFYEVDYDDYVESSAIEKYFEEWQKKTKDNPNWIPRKFEEFCDEENFYDWHCD